MKIPETPPDYHMLFSKLVDDPKYGPENPLYGGQPVDEKGRYLHWDELRFREPPENFDHEGWWVSLKIGRQSLYQKILNNKFKFANINKILEEQHWLDKNACGSISEGSPVVKSWMKNEYIINSLIEESITSSQLEGAATTRKIAKKMLLEGRVPRNKNERMIYNNYLAMQFIKENSNEALTPEMIIELQKILTRNTLEDESYAGMFRKEEDNVFIVDHGTNEILFVPPKAGEIVKRVKQLCEFANGRTKENSFIHPVMRSIIIHFLLAYIHPFVDGNGRTARALFYWSMLKNGYWLSEFISISRIIKKAPSKYAYSFLYTETDDNDLTYFIVHQLDVLRQAITEFREYAEKKVIETESAEELLNRNPKINRLLNYRQLSLIRHALKHPGYVYSISEYQNSNGIVYETARKDLELLSVKLKLLKKSKTGRSFRYVSPDDLKEKLSR